jgi:hypothetical protein
MLGLQRSDVSEYYPVNMDIYTQSMTQKYVSRGRLFASNDQKMDSKWLSLDNSSCIALIQYIHVHIATTPILGQTPGEVR